MNLLLVLFLFLNGLLLIFSVNEPEDRKIRPTFDEIYGKGWDKDGHEKIKVETSPLNSGENALNEQADHDDKIDQDVETYKDSTDQNLTQQDPDRIDQSDNETIEGINDINKFSEQQKREIISKFHAMREKVNKKGKFSATEKVKIECKIGTKLGVNRKKIYKWKKEFGLSRKTKKNTKSFYEKKKREFIERMNEIKMNQRGGQNKLIKDLGISKDTFINWKKECELPIDSKIKYSNSEKLKLMGKYYKIKQRNPQIKNSDIVKRLNISSVTLYNWKKQFGPTFNKNSIDEHSLPKKRHFFADNDTSEHPMPSSDDNLWAWNLATKKRTERTEVEHFGKK